VKRKVDLLAAGESFSMTPLAVVPPARSKSVNPHALKSNAQRALEAMREGIPRWHELEPRDVVGLHLVLHEHVHAVDDPLDAKQLIGAVTSAKRLVERLGGVEAAVDFVRWAWARNVSRNRWAEENGREPYRLTWWALASQRTVADYLVSRKPARNAR
jgi:hypothetical protein